MLKKKKGKKSIGANDNKQKIAFVEFATKEPIKMENQKHCTLKNTT